MKQQAGKCLAPMLALCVLGFGSGALAQNANAREEDATDRARAHMETGQSYFLSGQFVQAADEFQRAYEERPFSAFLFNAGVAYEKNREFGRAADFFSRYLERDPEASDRDLVRTRIERLRTQALDQQPAPTRDAGVPQPGVDAGVPPPVDAGAPPDAGTGATAPPEPSILTPDQRRELMQEFKSLFAIDTTPVGAQVTLTRDGAVVAQGPSPFAQTLTAGRYHLHIEHPNFQTRDRDFRMEPGLVQSFIVDLAQDVFPGVLRVITTPPNARVFIDDRSEGGVESPVRQTINEGEHRLWIERPGYVTEERTVMVEFGSEVEVRVDLHRVDYGVVRVNCNIGGAAVYLDDRQVGTVPFQGRAPAGPHLLRVESDGMKDYEVLIRVNAGQTTPVLATLRPSVGRAGAIVTAVISGLLIGGGIVTGVIANGLENDLQLLRDQGRLASNDSRITEGFFLSIGADIGLGVGALLALYSLYNFVRDPLPDSSGRVLEPRDFGVEPQLTPTTAGANAWWRF